MTINHNTFNELAENIRRRPVLSLCLTAISVRVLAFLVLAIHPIAGQGGHLVSPGLINYTTDMVQYLAVFENYFQSAHLIDNFREFYTSGYKLPRSEAGWIALAPALPILVEFFGYKNFSPYPLSIFVLISGCIYISLWIAWLREQNIGVIPVFILLLLPNTIWYTVSVSSDMIFSSIISVILFVYFKYGLSNRSITYIFILTFAAILIRPIGISVLLSFFFIYILDAIKYKSSWKEICTVLAIGLILSLASGIYYFPYFRLFSILSTDFTLFSVPVSQFKAGLFPNFPELIDQIASRALLVGAKLLSLVGIRPSYSDVAWPFVVLRSATGLITLPGLLYLLLKGEIRLRIIVVCFVAPVIAGLPMERYLLPILPILFCFGVKFYTDAWRAVTGRYTQSRAA
jgi:hypothetical protein